MAPSTLNSHQRVMYFASLFRGKMSVMSITLSGKSELPCARTKDGSQHVVLLALLMAGPAEDLQEYPDDIQ